jgi:hypothetical protein
MSKTPKQKEVSIRVRLRKETLERVDLLVGSNGRQKFIADAIAWRLDQHVPPVVLEMIDDIDALKDRVTHLEKVESTSYYIGRLTDEMKNDVCRDDLDKKLIAYLLQHEGATTPELARSLLRSNGKRRTVLGRIDKLNHRARTVLGVRILEHERGIVKGKRGAWFLVNIEKLLQA